MRKIESLTNESTRKMPWIPQENLLNLPGWQSKGGAHTPYKSLLIEDKDSNFRVNDAYQLLDSYLSHLKGSLTVKRAFMIYNENLISTVQFCKKSLDERFRSSAQVFKSNSWTTDIINASLRSQIIEEAKIHIKKFPWNIGADVPVIPMLHGTSLTTAWKIVQTGFATVATLDQGWYGRGIYFTSYTDYAIYFSKKANLSNPEDRCIIIAMVITGNIYPVTENARGPNSLMGKPVLGSGYQSHYVVVHSEATPYHEKGDVCHDMATNFNYYDELVVFNDTFAFPLFVVEYVDE